MVGDFIFQKDKDYSTMFSTYSRVETHNLKKKKEKTFDFSSGNPFDVDIVKNFCW